ncbi:MAG: ankyrin repeat domain-containing protein [Gemmatimonadota bacterium]|nr:ankyrin repeat domain-containing protein [Gemmatimonadota bacterium]
MSSQPPGDKLALPERPHLRHLKHQAADLLAAGRATSVADAQFQIARAYGFASWPKLKAHVEATAEVAELKRAIDTNDLERVKALMTANPELHEAPMGYAKDGPLTWVAECRVPWEPPSDTRLTIAAWMLAHGSDVHRGGDAPLMRAALNADRTQMMVLLVAHGADVNAAWHRHFPIIFAACETVDPVALGWLLDHGADPDCGGTRRWRSSSYSEPATALDCVIASYVREPERLRACIDKLLDAGGHTSVAAPGVMSILRGRIAELAELCASDRSLVTRRFPELDFGVTGERMLTLRGSTLLHVAAEYGALDAATTLIDGGADVNARATIGDAGVGGQTPIFHAATQRGEAGLAMVRLLIERGADLSVRAKLPGHYEREDEVVECTPLGYALRFPEGENRAVALLRERGAPP